MNSIHSLAAAGHAKAALGSPTHSAASPALQSVGVEFGAAIVLSYVVAFLLVRRGISRHFPEMHPVGRWVAIAFGTAILGSILESVVVFLFGALRPATIGLGLLGWLASGAGVYLVDAYANRAKWHVADVRQTHWFFAWIARSSAIYIISAFAAAATGGIVVSVAAALHLPAAQGVPLLIGCAIAMFFHSPSALFYRAVLPRRKASARA